jgi:hypothetical protein
VVVKVFIVVSSGGLPAVRLLSSTLGPPAGRGVRARRTAGVVDRPSRGCADPPLAPPLDRSPHTEGAALVFEAYQTDIGGET